MSTHQDRGGDPSISNQQSCRADHVEGRQRSSLDVAEREDLRQYDASPENSHRWLVLYEFHRRIHTYGSTHAIQANFTINY